MSADFELALVQARHLVRMHHTELLAIKQHDLQAFLERGAANIASSHDEAIAVVNSILDGIDRIERGQPHALAWKPPSKGWR